MAAPLAIPQRNDSIVQVKRAWGGHWQDIDGWASKVRLGMCNDMGAADVYTPSGMIRKPGASVKALIRSQDIGGQYARVLTRDDSGTYPGPGGRKYSPIFHGVIGGRGIASDEASGAFMNTYKVAGIMSILDSVTPKWHFAASADGELTADIGQQPVFNYLGSKKSGNRSADLYDFGDGVSAYVFDRGPGAKFWTAEDALNYWLALFHYFSDGGPTFSLAGQLDALAWYEKWDLSNHSCGEAVSRILSRKQSVGYRCSVPGSQPVITVKSLAPSSVTVPATSFSAGFTIPASDEQIIADLTDPTRVQRFSLQETTTAVADELSVNMDRDWYAVTFSLFDHFERDWTDADFAAWDAAKNQDAVGTLNTFWGVARVWRRFKLKRDWGGSFVSIAPGVDPFKMPTARSTSVGTLYGNGGLNGINLFSDAHGLAPGAMVELTGELPCLDGYDWSTTDPATADKTRRNAPIMAFMETAVGGSWTTLGQQCDPPQDNLEIGVDSDLSAITFGEAAAQILRAASEEGFKVYITIGVRSQLGTSVSWRRDTSERARDQTRCYGKNRPTLLRKVIPAGTVVGVNLDGELLFPTADVVLHDDTGLAGSILAVSQPWYTRSEWGVTYTIVGEVDTTINPCALLVEVDHLEGDGSTTEEDVIGVVAAVEYDLSDPGATTVTTRQVKIDVEAVI